MSQIHEPLQLSEVSVGARGFGTGHLVALVAVYAGLVLAFGSTRRYLGYGTETDFIGGFIPDAQRFLSGEPLLSQFHPPLYSIMVGSVYSLVGDWLQAGLAVSWIFGIASLFLTYFLFRRLCDRPAAWGAVLALLGSGVFLRYSLQASSDIFFLALFMGSCLLVLEALRARSTPLWGACGVAIGLALLTRANGVALLMLLLAPFADRATAIKARAVHGLSLLGGITVPVFALAAYAAATGSSVLPSEGHLNLAMTYFAEGEDRLTGDARAQIDGRFDGVLDVVLHDPAVMARTYVADLYTLLSRDLTTLVESPLYFLFLPGLFFLVGRNATPVFWVLFLAVAAQILLINFKAFEGRFYLFLVPWLGAAIGQMCWTVVRAEWSPRVRTTFASVLAAGFLAAVGVAVAKTYLYTHENTRELAEAVPVARQEVGEGATILARKPHLGFYTGAASLTLPNLDDLAGLRDYVQSHPTPGPLYVFYGEEERARRPQYAELAEGPPPAWLHAVARSRQPGAWVLFRYSGGVPAVDDRS